MAVTFATKPNIAPSWLKGGSDSQAAFQQAKFNAEKASAEKDLMRRFYLGSGEEKTVTFLDGALDDKGLLQFMSFNEHTINLGGKKWEDFVCTADQEICPLCNMGERATYVGVFTVLNHTPYTIKQGANAGKVLGDRRELYVAKLSTLRLLQTYATKWGGLQGWKVEITRSSGDKAPRVGDMFQKIKQRTPAVLASLYGENSHAADYSKEIRFMSAAELIAAGVGKAPTGPGFGNGQSAVNNAADNM